MRKSIEKYYDVELAKEILTLYWGRAKAQQELNTMKLADYDSLDKFNHRHKKLSHLLGKIENRLNALELLLINQEDTSTISDYIDI